MQLSTRSMELFLAYAKDADNWAGEPLFGGNVSIGTTKEDRGNLTQMKQAGLITTFVESGDTFIIFTAEGKKLAWQNGISINGYTEAEPEKAPEHAPEPEQAAGPEFQPAAHPIFARLNISDRNAACTLLEALRLYQVNFEGVCSQVVSASGKAPAWYDGTLKSVRAMMADLNGIIDQEMSEIEALRRSAEEMPEEPVRHANAFVRRVAYIGSDAAPWTIGKRIAAEQQLDGRWVVTDGQGIGDIHLNLRELTAWAKDNGYARAAEARAS